MNDLRQTLRQFLLLYHGNKICFFITGGGTSIAELGSIPGSSHALHAIYMPWADGALKSFKLSETSSSSVAGVKQYIKAMDAHLRRNDCEDVDVVVISAALPTVRTRRGPNRAVIGIKQGSRINIWEYKLPKEMGINDNWPISEHGNYDNYIDTERQKQDEQITRMVTFLLLRDDKNFRRIGLDHLESYTL